MIHTFIIDKTKIDLQQVKLQAHEKSVVYRKFPENHLCRFTPQMEIVYQSVATFFVQTLIEGYNGDIT